MRHAIVGKKLNRDSQHRHALFINLVSDLINHGRIVTTPAKAKAIQGMVDKLMTKAKKGGVHQRRLINHALNKSSLVNKLVDVISPLTKDRVSGFTRIIKLENRTGDNAPQVSIEWVDKPEIKAPVKGETAAVKKKAAKKPTVADKPKKPVLAPPTAIEPKVQAKTNAPKPGMIRQKSGER